MSNNIDNIEINFDEPVQLVEDQAFEEPINIEAESKQYDVDDAIVNAAVINAYNKGTTIQEELYSKEIVADVFRNKGEVFKDVIDNHINIKNEGLMEVVNNEKIATPEEAEFLINYANTNKEELKEEYSEDDIEKVKKEVYQYAGQSFDSEEEFINYTLSGKNVAARSQYTARATLNGLIERDGLLNEASSLGASITGKTLVDSLVGDFTIDTVKKDIEEYQAISNPELKEAKAKELAHAFYEGTDRNTFTTRFLIEQLNDPNYKNNIDNDTFIEAASMVLFSLGDVAAAAKVAKGAGTLAISGGKKAASKVVDKIDTASKIIKEGVDSVKATDLKEVVEGGASVVSGATKKGYKRASKIKHNAKNIALNITSGIKLNPVKSMDSMNNTSGAAEALMGYVKMSKNNPEIEKKLMQYTGLHQNDITNLASVSSQEELNLLRMTNPNLPENIDTAKKLQQNLREYLDEDLSAYKKITDTELTREAVTEGDKVNFINAKIQKLEEEAAEETKYNKQAYDFSYNLERDYDNNTIEIIKTKIMKDGSPEIVKKETIDLNVDVVSGFTAIEKNKYDIGNTDFLDWFKSEDTKLFYGIERGTAGTQSLVDDLTAINNQAQAFEDIAKGEYKKLVKQVNNLNKKQYELLNDVLKKGDEYTDAGINIGKDYNYFELKAEGLDDQTIKAYFSTRDHANALLDIRNTDKRAELLSKGYAEYEFSLVDDAIEQLKKSDTKYQINELNELKTFGVEIDNYGKIDSVRANDRDAIVYIQDKGWTIPIKDATNDLFEDSKLIKLVSPIGINENSVTYALVKTAKKNKLPKDVIEKRAGWIPRKYKARHYIYKENKYGKAEVVSGTIRASDIEKELEILQKKMKGEKLYVRTEGEDVALQPVKGTGFVDNLAFSLESDLSLTIGKRKKTLLVDSKGERLETEDLFDVMGNQIRVSAASRPLNVYRTSLIKRLEKTIIEAGEREGNADILVSSANVLEGIKPELLYKFRDEQRLINFVNKRVVDPSDPHFKKYSEKVKGYVNILDKKAGEKLPAKINEKMGMILKGAYELEKMNPIQGLKALSFIRLLGFFDPRQAILQAMQTTAIISINPVNGTKGVRDYAMWKLMKKNFRKDPKVLDDLMRKAETDLTDMDYAIIDLNKSNIMSSIQTNADLTLQNYGVFSKAKNKLDTFVEKGMYFYDLGNEMVYSTAFFAARREVLNGVKRQLSKEEMIKVQELTNKYAYNFTAANKAGFQDGLWSSAFQFMQVPAKAYESLVTSKLTNAEKLRLLAGQGLFFGYAGVPMGEAFASHIAKTLNLSESEVVNQYADKIIEMENGFIGSVLSNILDYEVSTDNMAFFGAGVADIPLAPIFTSLLQTNDSIQAATILKESFGPSFDTATKGLSLLSNTTRALGNFIVGDIDEGYVKAREAIFSTDSDLMKFFGTTSKLSKAIMILETGTEVDKYGNVYTTYEDDEKMQRAIGAMFGLNDIEKTKALVLRDQMYMLKDREKWIQRTAQDYYLQMEKDGVSQEKLKQVFYLHMKRNNVPLHTAYEAWNRVNAMVVNKLNSEDIKDSSFLKVRDAVFKLHEDGEKALEAKAYNVYKEISKEQ